MPQPQQKGLRKGITTLVLLALVCVFVMLMSGSSMWNYVGCTGLRPGTPISSSSSDLSGSDTAGTTADGVIVSPADTTVATPVKPTLAVDHEDVFEPDYVSDYYIVVYTLNSCVLVLEKDEYGKYSQQVKSLLCSAGSPAAPTDAGVYPIYRKHIWRYMMQVYGHYCSGFGYGTGYLFHSIPYLEEDNATLSGRRYDLLGTNDSHGCVRLCTRDAKWIFDNVPVGTLVHVLDNKNGPPITDPVPIRSTDNRYAGWDPTDPDPKNPYIRKPPAEVTYFTHTSAPVPTTTVAAQ